MKILAFSDVMSWKRWQTVVKRVRPDVIALAGDLACDSSMSDSLETHVEFFYRFLRFAGERAPVLVVKGNHDDDVEGIYLSDKINSIFGCEELSGKCETVDDVDFLGLGYKETHYLTRLRPLIAAFRNKVDVVITHCEQSRVPIITELNPRLIIRGHFGTGKWLVNEIPTVFTSGDKYAVLELGEKPSITQIPRDASRRARYAFEFSREKPSITQIRRDAVSMDRRRWPWLKPYPE